MKLTLFVDIHERKLVRSATSEFPVTLPTLFREDHMELEVTLLEPTGTISKPYSKVDVSAISLKCAIGNPDLDPEAFQNTFTADTANNKFTGTLNIHTTEMDNAFDNATGDTIARYFELEVEGTSSQFHTVLQQSITLHKDVIVNSLVAPVDVTSGSAFATSFAATVTDSTTVEWTKSGDANSGHFKGMSGLGSLTAAKFLKVKSDASGFELADGSGSGATSMDGLTDADTSTVSIGDHLKWDGSNWVPSSTALTHTHALDDLSDVDTSGAVSGQSLVWDGSSWAAGTNTSPNLWATVSGDSGSATADSTTDTLTVAGGEGINTTVSGDTLTVAGEDASETNKGIAKFAAADFTVTSGEVALDAVSIAKGGTAAADKETAFDNLSPGSTAGDLLTHDGSDNTRLAIGAADQVLTVNSGATAVEWAAAGGGGGGSGTVTSVTVDGGTGLTDTGSPVTTSGTITLALDDTSVTAGSYTAADISVDAQGRITSASSGGPASNEISFRANIGAADQSVDGDPAYTVVAFDTAEFNNGAAFNTSNYRFEVATAGRYLLSASIVWDDALVGKTWMAIRKNGTDIAGEQTTVDIPTAHVATNDITTIVDAAADDYFDVLVWHNDSSGSADVRGSTGSPGWTQFTGHLIAGAVDGGADKAFKTISVSGQSNVIADSIDDVLTLVAGSGVTLTTDASADSVTIAAASGGGGSVAGSDTHVQFNNSSAFGGSADLTWDDTHLKPKNIAFPIKTVTDADTVTLSFDDEHLQTLSADRAAITLATSNRAAGKTLTLRLKNVHSDGYTSLGVTGAAWQNIPDGANSFSSGSYLYYGMNLVLKLTCWGTAETDITAEWADESSA